MIRRTRLTRLLLLLALLAPSEQGEAQQESLSTTTLAALDSLFRRHPNDHEIWGVSIQDATSGALLYEIAPEQPRMPASTQKIVTAAIALATVGPDFRFRTPVFARGRIDDLEKTLHGDLILRGEGDPTISERFHTDPRLLFHAWADSLHNLGIRTITGAVLADGSAFERFAVFPGWERYGEFTAYAAPFGALLYNEGYASLRVRPGPQVGRPAQIGVSPGSPLQIENHVVTGSAKSRPNLRMERSSDGTTLLLRGSVPHKSRGVGQSVSLRTPAQALARVLTESLKERGIEVHGNAQETTLALSGAEQPDTTLRILFVHQSPPLRDILPVSLKASQNQVSENVLRGVTYALRGMGSTPEAASLAQEVFLNWGLIPPPQLHLADGSGLSRANRITPRFLSALLVALWHSPYQDDWWSALPTAGVDGTLKNRFRGTEVEGRLKAKTGTLRDVKALAGYVETRDGRRLAFTMLANLKDTNRGNADRTIERAVLTLAQESRK